MNGFRAQPREADFLIGNHLAFLQSYKAERVKGEKNIMRSRFGIPLGGSHGEGYYENCLSCLGGGSEGQGGLGWTSGERTSKGVVLWAKVKEAAKLREEPVYVDNRLPSFQKRMGVLGERQEQTDMGREDWSRSKEEGRFEG